MKVTLVNYTGRGTANPSRYAAAQLIFTKATRLTMSPGLLVMRFGYPPDIVQTRNGRAETAKCAWNQFAPPGAAETKPPARYSVRTTWSPFPASHGRMPALRGHESV